MALGKQEGLGKRGRSNRSEQVKREGYSGNPRNSERGSWLREIERKRLPETRER